MTQQQLIRKEQNLPEVVDIVLENQNLKDYVADLERMLQESKSKEKTGLEIHNYKVTSQTNKILQHQVEVLRAKHNDYSVIHYKA